MYPYIDIVLPTYTVMALLGGFAALLFLFFRLEQFQIPFSLLLKLGVFCVIGGLLGSKLLFAITQIPWLIQNFSLRNLLMLLPESGLVFYGGLFGVIFSIWIATRKDFDMRKRVFQMAAPAMPLFHAFGRVGCFLSGCCYGKTLSRPIAVGPITFTQIPVQLIESCAEMILFFVLLAIEKHEKDVNLLKIYLLLYATIRFADEFLRGDEIRGIFLGLSTAQWISIAIVLYYFMNTAYDFLNRKTAAA